MTRAVPVVSCDHPSAFRNTAAAAARRLGVSELVAASPSDMARLAVDLGSDELALLDIKLRMEREAHTLMWHGAAAVDDVSVTSADASSADGVVGAADDAAGWLGKPQARAEHAQDAGAAVSEQSRTLGDWSAFLQRVGAPWAALRGGSAPR